VRLNRRCGITLAALQVGESCRWTHRMSERSFRPDMPVEFKSSGDKGAHIVHARYVKRIDDLYSLVDDHSGLKPRIIRTARLHHAVSGFAPAPVAA
jgi:hypothetical protein